MSDPLKSNPPSGPVQRENRWADRTERRLPFRAHLGPPASAGKSLVRELAAQPLALVTSAGGLAFLLLAVAFAAASLARRA